MADTATWHLVRQGEERPFVVEGDVIVGRSKQADLRVSEGFVSRRHARLWIEGGTLMVEDLGSANGTFVNGRRISSRSPLNPGDRVSFDETEYHVEMHAARSPADPNATAHRPDEVPSAHKPERPPDWDQPPPGAPSSAPESTRSPPEQAPAASASRAADETADLDLDFDQESEAPSPSEARAPKSAPESEDEGAATVEAPMDLSMGHARPATETNPAPASAGATVVMSPDEAPGQAGSAPAPAPAAGGEAAGLLGLSGPVEGQLYQLADGRVAIGRSPECDIHIEESSVSKRHAELMVQPGNTRIYGLSSSNGVFVNGNQVDDVALNPGDVIRLGRVEIMFDNYQRLLDTGAAGGLPPWAWMIVGFVGAGAILGVGAFFLL